MSVKVMSRVWESAACKGSELLVLLAMADFADDDGGNIFPSVPTLAAKVRLTDRAVQIILRRLEENGFIEVEAEAGRRAPRRYRIVMVTAGVTTTHPSAGAGVKSIHPTNDSGVKDSSSRGEKSCRSGVNPISPESSRNRQEPARAREARPDGLARRCGPGWQHRVGVFLASGTWSKSWGPEPTDSEIAEFRKAAGWNPPIGAENHEQLDLAPAQTGDAA